MPISFDDQLKAMDALIEREKTFVRTNKGKYHSGFIAKKDRDIEIFEAVRETVRAARQNQSMTTMSGKRIDE